MIPLSIRLILKRALRVYGGKDGERALAWINAQPVDGPTPSEFEIIRLIAEGLETRDIVAKLGITEKALKSHMTRIYSKLGVSSRVNLTIWAIRNGYIVIPIRKDEDEEE